HPDVGASIIKSLNRWLSAAEIVLYHHERMDGSGYPFHLKGDRIPLAARIVAVADAYDAMISERPYRKALSKEEAIRELIRNKGRFDPDVVDLFCESLR
ncbi:TPA: HD domain-containing protein, partial [Candidatus Poribacteria bacterium]|nr:HD domain-containing protein [Candidatus Poribacteria bacterium]